MLKKIDNVIDKYLDIKEQVIHFGYEYEIEWQENIDIEKINETDFLREYAWVIFSSGFKESILRTKFDGISNAFNNWVDVDNLNRNKQKNKIQALKIFNNKSKMDGVCDVIQFLHENGFQVVKDNLIQKNENYFYQFKFLGPVTTIHLFKNLGVSTVKPDRHLMRIADALGFKNPLELCTEILEVTGDSLNVIDIIFWRWATIEPHYIEYLSK